MKELMKIEINGDPKYTGIIKMAMGTLLSTEEFCIDEIEDISMAVSEACKIITCHERSQWRNSYELSCLLGERQIQVIIRGNKENGSMEKYEIPCLECLSEGDLGLEIIKSLMDEVEWKKGETGYEEIKLVKGRC